MELEALVLTSSAACLACWAVELWKLGPVVVVVVAERGGQSRPISFSHSRRLFTSQLHKSDCKRGCDRDSEWQSCMEVSAGSYRLTYAQALIKLDAFP